MSLATATATVLAHGFGGPGVLGVDVVTLLTVAGALVLGCGGLLSARAARAGAECENLPSLHRAALPASLTAVIDHRATRLLLRALGLVGLVGLLVVAAAGDPLPDRNPAAALTFVVAWGGTFAAAVALGPVWRRVDPLRVIGRVLLPPTAASGPSAATGYRAATAALLVVVVVELALPTSPLLVLVFLLGYAAAQLAAAARHGPAWWDRAELLAVISALFGRLAPWGRDEGGRIGVRSPRAAIARLAISPRVEPDTARTLAVLLGVLVGAAAFDGVADSETWIGVIVGRGRTAEIGLALVGLAVGVSAGVGASVAATRVHVLTPALIPLAAAWVVPLYLGAILLEGPRLAAQLGADVLPDASLAPVAVIAWGQLALFVAGHLGAVAVGHDLAVAHYDLRSARAAQFLLRAVVTASLLGGIWLRFGLE